jgi:hypothetical protein
VTIDPLVAFIALALGVVVAALMIWLAEWRPGDDEIPPPGGTIEPKDWRRW